MAYERDWAAKVPPPKQISARPKLTAEKVVEYLDWIGKNSQLLKREESEVHLRLAELAIRTSANEAQGKATQHTLVEDGVIEPPPAA